MRGPARRAARAGPQAVYRGLRAAVAHPATLTSMRHLSRFQLGRVGLVVGAVTLGTSTAVAQARQPGAAPRDTSTRPIRDTLRAAVRDSLRPSTRDFLSMVETPPVVSRHSIRLHGSTFSFTATTGMLPIRNDTTGAVEGGIFFVAYNKDGVGDPGRSEEHTSELQSQSNLVCRLLLEKKKI